MNLFGCKFCEKSDREEQQCDRKNFDTLLWALVTVFQVVFFSVFIILFYLREIIYYFVNLTVQYFYFIKIGLINYFVY